MTAIGSISITPVYTTAFSLPFAAAQFPDGWPMIEGQPVGEPINAMGVNWTRYRIVRQDAPLFRMRCLTDCITYGAAVTNQNAILAGRFGLATISITCAGTLYTFGDAQFYVTSVQSVPRPGAVIGTSQVVDGAQAYLDTMFSLQYKGA